MPGPARCRSSLPTRRLTHITPTYRNNTDTFHNFTSHISDVDRRHAQWAPKHQMENRKIEWENFPLAPKTSKQQMHESSNVAIRCIETKEKRFCETRSGDVCVIRNVCSWNLKQNLHFHSEVLARESGWDQTKNQCSHIGSFWFFIDEYRIWMENIRFHQTNKRRGTEPSASIDDELKNKFEKLTRSNSQSAGQRWLIN